MSIKKFNVNSIDALFEDVGFSQELIQDLKAIIGLDYRREGMLLYFLEQGIDFPLFDCHDEVMRQCWDRLGV